MGDRYLWDLGDVCRSAGLVVHEVSGWPTRARGSGGYSPGLPSHVMIHHTASNTSPQNDVNYICYGADAAPLANLYLSREGEVWVCAGGATNTNGSGHDWWGGGVPDDSMNTHAIGIEAGNNGTGEPWPVEQQQAYVALCQALCVYYNIPVNNVREHAEWAPGRKIDPAGPSAWASGKETWWGDGFRQDVGDTAPTPEPIPQEDEMATVILAVEGRNAQFVAQGPLLADGSVHCLFITWFGPGPDSDFLSDHRAAPDTRVQPTLMSTLKRDLILLGNPEDIDDSTGRWSEGDFYRVIRS